MFLRARRNFPERILTIFSPLSQISPDVGFSSRFTQRIKVLFPAPDGPMSAITWPFSTLRSTPFMAKSPVLYFLTSCFISSIDILQHAEACSVPREIVRLRTFHWNRGGNYLQAYETPFALSMVRITAQWVL